MAKFSGALSRLFACAVFLSLSPPSFPMPLDTTPISFDLMPTELESFFTALPFASNTTDSPEVDRALSSEADGTATTGSSSFQEANTEETIAPEEAPSSPAPAELQPQQEDVFAVLETTAAPTSLVTVLYGEETTPIEMTTLSHTLPSAGPPQPRSSPRGRAFDGATASTPIAPPATPISVADGHPETVTTEQEAEGTTLPLEVTMATYPATQASSLDSADKTDQPEVAQDLIATTSVPFETVETSQLPSMREVAVPASNSSVREEVTPSSALPSSTSPVRTEVTPSSVVPSSTSFVQEEAASSLVMSSSTSSAREEAALSPVMHSSTSSPRDEAVFSSVVTSSSSVQKAPLPTSTVAPSSLPSTTVLSSTASTQEEVVPSLAAISAAEKTVPSSTSISPIDSSSSSTTSSSDPARRTTGCRGDSCPQLTAATEAPLCPGASCTHDTSSTPLPPKADQSDTVVDSLDNAPVEVSAASSESQDCVGCVDKPAKPSVNQPRDQDCVGCADKPETPEAGASTSSGATHLNTDPATGRKVDCSQDAMDADIRLVVILVLLTAVSILGVSIIGLIIKLRVKPASSRRSLSMTICSCFRRTRRAEITPPMTEVERGLELASSMAGRGKTAAAAAHPEGTHLASDVDCVAGENMCNTWDGDGTVDEKQALSEMSRM